MTQKDSRNRTAFQIASDNNFLDVLQNPEIGTIIGKMWNGEISHNGIKIYYKRIFNCFFTVQIPGCK